MPDTPDTVLRFWFEALTPQQWWTTDPALDAHIGQRFAALLQRAAAAELQAWRATAAGRLAEVIVLDQYSRNIHRNTPRAFAQDGMALALAQEGVLRGVLDALPRVQRTFLLMPYMHSESAVIHAEATVLFERFTPAESHDFELQHKAIIDRFGRYPHRNEILGRPSTAEEQAFLRQPGSSF